ncbi:MAG TPA: stage 0 sporulation family protein [Dehalococcoidia bacterium]|jgi:cell fate regulator YaaT (PSP1 superfamily)|nr:stage 0 sporulation family protein [Dehalococcoidia bacterium]
MADIVGVRFKRAGRIYYFDPAEIELEVNDHVVVKTAHGLELGQVVIAPKQVLASELTRPLKPVVRKAEPEDIERVQKLADKEREALAECAKLVAKLNLPMKLISAEYNLDGNHLSFFFSAEERVDFRELVRELTGRFKIRVELRQVGPRDGAKLIGGFGRCGRPLCCMSFLGEFAPVSVKMAKEQNLPLNPMKISGTCGRLLCCLVYENEQYRNMKEKMPKEGQQVSTPMGVVSVVGSNPLKETVLVELESKATVELPLSEVTVEDKPPISEEA